MFIERCLARRKLFSSYSNLIQNSLWTSSQHPLFSKAQFRLFKFQVRRTFVRLLFFVIIYCLGYGTYTYMLQTSSIWSRFYFFIPFLQLFYLLIVNILFSFFFFCLNSLIAVSELLKFTFLKDFVFYTKRYIIHRTFLSATLTSTPAKIANDVSFSKLIHQTKTGDTLGFLPSSELEELVLSFFSFKKSIEYQLNFFDTASYDSYLRRFIKGNEFSIQEDYFSLEYNLRGNPYFPFLLSSTFNNFRTYYWDFIYKKNINLSLIYHWLSTNPTTSYSDLRLAAESFSFFNIAQPHLTVFSSANLSPFNSFKQSVASLLARQTSFFQTSLFFKARTACLFQNSQLNVEIPEHTFLSFFFNLSNFATYFTLFGNDSYLKSFNNINKNNSFSGYDSNFSNFNLFWVSDFSKLDLLGCNSFFLWAFIERSTFNLQIFPFTFNFLFSDNSSLFEELFIPTVFRRSSRIRVNYIG